MAVIKVTKAFGDEWSEDENGILVRAAYLVQAEATDTPLIARGAVDPNTGMTVPGYLDPLAEDPNLKATTIGGARAEDPKAPLFRVSIEYRANANEKPTPAGKWNKRVSSSGSEVVERVNKDVDGNPIYNTVGDLYQADLELVLYDEQLTVSYSTKESDGLIDLGQSRGLVNDSPVTLTITRYGRTYTRTFPEKTLKLGNASWDIDIGSDGDGMFNVNIPLIARHQRDKDGNEIGWQVQVPNRGERFYPTSSSQTPVKSNRGVLSLAEDGTELPTGELQFMLIIDAIPAVDFSLFLDGL